MLSDQRHCLGYDTWPDTEGAFDHAFFANRVAGQVEGAALAFSQGAHHLETLDCGVGRPHRLETPDRLDQLLELAVIGLDHIIQILDLAVFHVLRKPPGAAV